MFPAKVYAIFPLAAGQLKRNRVIILKKCIPVAFHVFGILQHITVSINGPETNQFFVSHKVAKFKFHSLNSKLPSILSVLIGFSDRIVATGICELSAYTHMYIHYIFFEC